jgi:post-segregation antitoxin (ccd killing protein)
MTALHRVDKEVIGRAKTTGINISAIAEQILESVTLALLLWSKS